MANSFSNFRLSLALACSALSTPTMAQEQADAVQLFAQRLTSGETEAAFGQIVGVVPLSGTWERDFALPDHSAVLQFVPTCMALGTARDEPGAGYLKIVDLDCGGASYALRLLPVGRTGSPYVRIVGLRSEAMIAAEISESAAAQSPPIQMVATSASPMSEKERNRAEQRRRRMAELQDSVIGEIARNMTEGDFSSLEAHFAEDSIVSYRIRDPYFAVDIVRREGTGFDEFRSQMLAAREQYGPITEHQCDGASGRGYSPVLCRWFLDDGNHQMFAIVYFRGEEIAELNSYYMTFDDWHRLREQAEERGLDTENLEPSIIPPL